MIEKVIYDQNGITVTSKRVVFGMQTFQLAGITSVLPQSISPNRIGPIILIIIGLLFAGIPSIGGIIWWYLQKPKYVLVIVTAAGETPALTTNNKDQVLQITNAINQAMAECI
jgi:hypothetical protein